MCMFIYVHVCHDKYTIFHAHAQTHVLHFCGKQKRRLLSFRFKLGPPWTAGHVLNDSVGSAQAGLWLDKQDSSLKSAFLGISQSGRRFVRRSHCFPYLPLQLTTTCNGNSSSLLAQTSPQQVKVLQPPPKPLRPGHSGPLLRLCLLGCSSLQAPSSIPPVFYHLERLSLHFW